MGSVIISDSMLHRTLPNVSLYELYIYFINQKFKMFFHVVNSEIKVDNWIVI